MKLGVLVSGGLGMTLLDFLSQKYNVTFVMTDRKSDAIRSFCEESDIPLFVGNPREGKSASFIADKQIDVLVSVNYLFIIEEDLIRLPEILAFNVHGSLLPKYRGRTPHVWAIINNEPKTGITAHVIDEGCDTGDLLEQIEIAIDAEDTGASILKKFEKAYPQLVDNVLSKIISKELTRTRQDHTKATWFGKRTPEDGEINWNWYKERTVNWVRAQAYPYPGAFTWHNDTKITIDKVIHSDMGFDQKMPNGQVIATNPLCVKTPNGVLAILETREDVSHLKQGDILN